MARSPAPIKTALGADELRGRSRTLGQRHRTVLLLVDGRRSINEVVSLAQQAGAQASHFEDLLRMGMVAMPEVARSEPVPRPETGPTSSSFSSTAGSAWPSVAASSRREPDPGPSSQGAGRERRSSQSVPASSVWMDLPDSGNGAEGTGEVVPSRHPQAPPVAPAVAPPVALPVAAAAAPAVAPAPEPVARRVTRESEPQPRRHAQREAQREAPAPRRRPPAAAPTVSARPAPQPQHLPNPAARSAPDAPVPPLSIRDEVLGMAAAPALGARQPPNESESQKLERIRTLLQETLRIDSPVFGARMLLRLREATTRDDLIDIVWAIERHLADTRYPRKEMLSLHRARELLGLGNTVVPDE
jgi:hypothetical protein